MPIGAGYQDLCPDCYSTDYLSRTTVKDLAMPNHAHPGQQLHGGGGPAASSGSAQQPTDQSKFLSPFYAYPKLHEAPVAALRLRLCFN